MAVVSHTVNLGSVSGTRQNVTYDFLDSAGGHTLVRKLLPIGTDFDADALSMYPQIEAQLASAELSEAYNKVDNRQNPDKVPPDHNTQVDFDRKVLGYIMTVQDPHQVNACLPFWQAVQPRNGANSTVRATNLGVPQAEYDQVEDRLNAYFGASTFLSNDLSAIWDQGWD